MENYIEDDIRQPDIVISDKLLDDDRSEYEKDIEAAIQISYEELIHHNEINSKYENEIINKYNEQLLERKNKCNTILFDIKKITNYDKEIKEIYEIIEPILELYYHQNINYCVFDDKTYNRIFNLISKIRTDKKNIEFLKSIIVKEETTNYKIIN